jgi:hypothetical protein
VQPISRSYEEHKTSTCLPPHNSKGSKSEEHLLLKHSFSVKMLRIIIDCLSKTKGHTCRHAFSMISNLFYTSKHPRVGALFRLLLLLNLEEEAPSARVHVWLVHPFIFSILGIKSSRLQTLQFQSKSWTTFLEPRNYTFPRNSFRCAPL